MGINFAFRDSDEMGKLPENSHKNLGTVQCKYTATNFLKITLKVHHEYNMLAHVAQITLIATQPVKTNTLTCPVATINRVYDIWIFKAVAMNLQSTHDVSLCVFALSHYCSWLACQ